MTEPIDERTAAREAALRATLEEARRLASPEDYVYDKGQESFWDLKDGTLHKAEAVDASIPIERWRVEVQEAPPPPAEGEPARRGRPARRRERLIAPSRDIMRVENDQFVEGSTWWPGRPQLIRDWFIDKDGFFPSVGRRIYNQYKAPPVPRGNPAEAGVWVEHVKKLWPEEAEHEYFFDYCAHLVQRPAEKCNTGVVLSGTQGIGKDAALLPVKMAVGAWNTKGIDPDQLFLQFKPWLQTLMLVVDEVRPSKDEHHASSMYNVLKPLMAAPPMTLPMEDKHVKLRYVINVMRVFITTNDWMAMYIPQEDRRMFILHSNLPQRWNIAEGRPDYFVNFFTWLDSGGAEAVAAWLAARDLSRFNPKAEAVKTAGWNAVAATWGEPDDGIAFALEHLGKPDVVFGAELADPPFDSRDEIAAMLKSPRTIGHRMQKAGYVIVRNPDDERWTFRKDGRTFRSSLAFVKQSACLSPDRALTLLRERGAAKVVPATTGTSAARF